MARPPDPVARGEMRRPPGDAVAQLFAIAGELTGVQLDERHREMVKSRMLKRVGELGLPSLDDYLLYYAGRRGQEGPHIVSLLTTHHSYFYREPAHFGFLAHTGLAQLLPQVRARPDRTLKAWSAACSRGQEVYSLAMVLGTHLRALDRQLRYTVLGTDVDEESLEIARNGVYRHTDLEKVPPPLLQDHWARGSDEINAFVKVRRSLREHCHFARQNILDQLPATGERFDIIFCRNVFIYFNEEQIRRVVRALIGRLHPGGYLFAGISESLTQMKLPLRSVGPSIYQALVPDGAGALPDAAGIARGTAQGGELAGAAAAHPAGDADAQAHLPPYDTARTLRIVVMPLSHRIALVSLFAELTGEQPPCVVMFDGVRPELLAETARVLSRQTGRQIDYAATVPGDLAAGSVTLLDLRSQAAPLAAQHGGQRRCALLVYGDVSRAAAALLCEFSAAQILLEDLGGGVGTPHLMARASDVVAPSNFAHHSAHFLRKR